MSTPGIPNDDLIRLLRLMGKSKDAISHGHDIIFNAAANRLEIMEQRLDKLCAEWDEPKPVRTTKRK